MFVRLDFVVWKVSKKIFDFLCLFWIDFKKGIIQVKICGNFSIEIQKLWRKHYSVETNKSLNLPEFTIFIKFYIQSAFLTRNRIPCWRTNQFVTNYLVNFNNFLVMIKFLIKLKKNWLKPVTPWSIPFNLSPRITDTN